MTEQLKNYRVWFSVLRPAEGYTDVQATDKDHAAKLVQGLIEPNYKDLNIVEVQDLSALPVAPSLDMEELQTAVEDLDKKVVH